MIVVYLTQSFGEGMSEKRVVMVVDMQRCLKRRVISAKSVFPHQSAHAGSRHGHFYSAYRSRRAGRGSEGFALLPELEQPAGAFYVTKTACDSFYNTGLAALLREQDINAFVICGCATDYCVDATIKNGEPRLSHYRRGRCPYHRKSPGGAGANPD
jgi:nicotinamidase-related amidase